MVMADKDDVVKAAAAVAAGGAGLVIAGPAGAAVAGTAAAYAVDQIQKSQKNGDKDDSGS
jgi:hypothetical protein